MQRDLHNLNLGFNLL